MKHSTKLLEKEDLRKEKNLKATRNDIYEFSRKDSPGNRISITNEFPWLVTAAMKLKLFSGSLDVDCRLPHCLHLICDLIGNDSNTRLAKLTGKP